MSLFYNPRSLHEFLVDPTDAHLAVWVGGIHDCMRNIEQSADPTALSLDLGMEFREFVLRVHTSPHATLPFRVMVAMLYIMCTPVAQSSLSASDRAFVDVFKAKWGEWITGMDADGQPFDTRRPDSHTVAFAWRMMRLYQVSFQHAH